RWKRCEPTTLRALYEIGFVFAGRIYQASRYPSDSDEAELAKACPSSWTEIPIEGTYILSLELVEEKGGVRLLDNFMPADGLIQRAWLSRWPRCGAERQRLGYPKLCRGARGALRLGVAMLAMQSAPPVIATGREGGPDRQPGCLCAAGRPDPCRGGPRK